MAQPVRSTSRARAASRRARSSRRRLVALFPLAVILLGACAPDAITDTGDDVGFLYDIVLVMATVVFVGVEAAIIYNAVRYRRRKKDTDDTLPPQTHGNTFIEVVWTAIPAIIVLALFVASMLVLSDVDDRRCPATGGAAETVAQEDFPEGCSDVIVDVYGFQWQWRFDYKDRANQSSGVTIQAEGQFDPPQLVLPVGRRIHFNLIAGDGLSDVIHAFYLPDFLFKRDIIPGRTNAFELVIEEDAIGTYKGQCAELCGDLHNAMTFELLTMTGAEFDQWLEAEAKKQAEEGACSPTGTELQVEAIGIAFDKDCLAAPAGSDFTIEFVNSDEGVPHNVAIYADQGAQQDFFIGEVFNGIETRTYEVKAITEPGEYIYRCDIHPDSMVETFVVK